jgi:hypothetical protein
MKMRSVMVYVVMKHDYEDREPITARRNKRLAEKEAERLIGTDGRYYDVVEIPLMEEHHI